MGNRKFKGGGEDLEEANRKKNLRKISKIGKNLKNNSTGSLMV